VLLDQNRARGACAAADRKGISGAATAARTVALTIDSGRMRTRIDGISAGTEGGDRPPEA
jgi:hypothetical protein